MPKVIVVHEGYGCETGCCGHVVYVDDSRRGQFDFSHPAGQDVKDYVRALVTAEAGAEHVKDIDFDACIVVDED